MARRPSIYDADTASPAEVTINMEPEEEVTPVLAANGANGTKGCSGFGAGVFTHNTAFQEQAPFTLRQALTPESSPEEPAPHSVTINPYMVAVTNHESTFATCLCMTGDTWTTSPETTSGSPDSFDDIGGALDNERTPERVMQAMQDEGLGPEFSIPRANDFVVSSIKRADSMKRAMRSPRSQDAAVLSRWNSRGTRTRRATTGSFLRTSGMTPVFFSALEKIRPGLGDDVDKICNMTLSILGPGVLTIPYALKTSGVVLGMAMFILGAGLNAYTSFLLMADVNKLEAGAAKTFENMAFKLFGAATEKVLRWSLVVLLFGFVCGNLVALAPLLQELALGFGVTGLSPTGLLAAVCSTVLIPMASIPDIALLGKWSSPIGVVSLSMLVVIVVFKFATSEIDPDAPPVIVHLAKFDMQSMLTFPIASFAFNLQPYIFPVFFPTKEASNGDTVKKLMFDEEGVSRNDTGESESFQYDVGQQIKKNVSFQTWRNRWIIIIAMALSFVIYMLTGVIGYLHFGEATQSNILLNYNSEKDAATWLVYGVMVTTIIVVFPLNVFPLRSLIDDMILEHYKAQYELRLPEFAWCRFLPETFAIIGAAFVVNVVCNDISLVFSLTGATACTSVAYMLPCMFSARTNGGWTPLLAAVTALTVGAGLLSLFQIFMDMSA